MLTPDVLELTTQLGHIFYFIVLPVLLLAVLGFVLQRTLGLEMDTLKRLNFYFIIPAIIYCSLVSAEITLQDVGTVIVFVLALQAAMGGVTYTAAALRGIPREKRTALMMTTMYYNSGNFGLPMQELAFRDAGLGAAARSIQVFVMLTQNVMSFTVGVFLAAGGRRDLTWRSKLLHIARLPPIYAVLAAVVTVQFRHGLGGSAEAVADALRPFWTTLAYIADAFIAVALATLGAQLGTVRGTNRRDGRSVRLSVFIRLLGAPVAAFAIIVMLGLEGLIAQVLLISSASPTAVNCMLLCLEFDNNAELAARAVFYSTLLCPVTVTLVVFAAKSGVL